MYPLGIRAAMMAAPGSRDPRALPPDRIDGQNLPSSAIALSGRLIASFALSLCMEAP
ncbi:hypothetical protein GCM10007301_03830 [Azorhizobium oxalatiphilum]|uniref:Uncharacterized protein n=1 Tax=Azorhizobium oxalatiphilum TaxID=980631 RepID=A0A917F684_9HYPH|nr:hypothetical protein GCM10007301_03830 [Azorhizobium oxalatiphilum]